MAAGSKMMVKCPKCESKPKKWRYYTIGNQKYPTGDTVTRNEYEKQRHRNITQHMILLLKIKKKLTN